MGVPAMASTWAVSTFPEDVTFTYNWTIDDLVKALERDVDGAIESPSFKMPGLPWDFFLRITRTLFKYKTDPDGEITEFRYPKKTPDRRGSDSHHQLLWGSTLRGRSG